MKAGITIACLLIAGIASFAEEDPFASVEIKSTKVSEQIHMLEGQGGNIGLFIGEDGTFLIDDQFAPLTDKILSAIRAAGGDIPKFLINTHYHFDHTGGNEALGEAGTLIFSHHNVRERLLTGTFIAPFNTQQEPTAPEGLPVVTFSENVHFHLNGDTVEVIHIPRAHTDGDCIIVFRRANVIHAGDILFNGMYPFIDVDHGGSLKGMIQGIDRILERSDENTNIIAGHGPLATKADLTAYREMLQTAFERLGRLKEEGKTVAEAIAEKPLEDLESAWGGGMITGDRWIEFTYPGIK
jgi:cyclase